MMRFVILQLFGMIIVAHGVHLTIMSISVSMIVMPSKLLALTSQKGDNPVI